MRLTDYLMRNKKMGSANATPHGAKRGFKEG
jgi:hypothetical protein